ncbi:MAG: amidohydrolase [Ilumatobacter sp.]|uniref:amidohydrolase n=1 Tax=Ilumatobacter sp. TaxID=1967498 RepID=UPI00260BFD2A|nr:amidohydrolase [Ilumatobacter sp.]MDJ0769150.1 amidohydrolase [Ilumatobacter sp.]
MTSTPSAVERPIDTWLAAHGEGLIALRRNLHAHPELSGEEYATTDLVYERLHLAGLSPVRLTSGTGLVCDIDAGEVAGPIFALRADIDALGMHDEKDVPYRSQVPGVSHACGHDVHTAVMLGAALFFAHHRDELPGRLRMIFQPAEERVPGGALDVLADRALDGVDGMIGFHCDPKLDVGRIGLRAGAITSAADMARIVLTGSGGHTARPEQTVDMVTLAATVITELPRLVAEACGGFDRVRFVFGSVHAGDAANVIPTHCELKASVRTPVPEVWDKLSDIVGRALTDLLDGSGAGFELDYTDGVPPVVNDAAMTELVRTAALGELGADAITPAVQSWGGDDFSWFTREVPATYVRLGVHDVDNGGPRLDLHAGRFDVDERAIDYGVRLAVATATTFFESYEHGAAPGGG